MTSAFECSDLMKNDLRLEYIGKHINQMGADDTTMQLMDPNDDSLSVMNEIWRRLIVQYALVNIFSDVWIGIGDCQPNTYNPSAN
jgi:hypothetical protein